VLCDCLALTWDDVSVSKLPGGAQVAHRILSGSVALLVTMNTRKTKNRIIGLTTALVVTLGMAACSTPVAHAEETVTPAAVVSAESDTTTSDRESTPADNESARTERTRAPRTPLDLSAVQVAPAAAAAAATAEVGDGDINSLTLNVNSDQVPVWRVEVTVNDQRNTVTVNAATGEVLSVREHSAARQGTNRESANGNGRAREGRPSNGNGTGNGTESETVENPGA